MRTDNGQTPQNGIEGVLRDWEGGIHEIQQMHVLNRLLRPAVLE
jgi:hypothetical protein